MRPDNLVAFILELVSAEQSVVSSHKPTAAQSYFAIWRAERRAGPRVPGRLGVEPASATMHPAADQATHPHTIHG